MLVEVPLPWPREITDHPLIAPARDALARAGLRVQALLPRPTSTRERRQVVRMTRRFGPFDRYIATPFVVSEIDFHRVLVDLARSAEVCAPAPALTGEDAAMGLAPVAADDVTAEDRHVLVCTHGRRDACCGTLGTRLSLEFSHHARGVHLWRTSHTGGHRFAPTAILLPEGTAWAFLDSERLTGILDRTLDPAGAADLYRGCAGIDSAEIQAADGGVFRVLGWDWLDYARAGRVVATDGRRTRVMIHGESPRHDHRGFGVTIEVTRVLPVPECGLPVDHARKSAPEFRVTDVVPL